MDLVKFHLVSLFSISRMRIIENFNDNLVSCVSIIKTLSPSLMSILKEMCTYVYV